MFRSSFKKIFIRSETYQLIHYIKSGKLCKVPVNMVGSDNNSEDKTISLTARVAQGAGWIIFGKIVGQALNIIKIVILARLLSKDDFGLFGIVMLTVATLKAFSSTGFIHALIQRKDNAQLYLDTVWTVELIRGFILCGLLLAFAPSVGWFFDEPRVVILLRVMCLSVIIDSFVNIGIINFRKELEFKKQVIYDVGNTFVSLVVGVLIAFYFCTVWALIFAGIASAATRLILSYTLHDYRPTFRFNKTQVAKLFMFGRWIFGSSIVLFLATSGDDAILGKMMGASALGLYQVAYRLSNVMTTEITHTISAVMFPAYAKIQDQKVKLGHGFLSVLELVTSISLPFTVFIVIAAPEIIIGILGPEWGAAIIPFQILSVSGFLRSIAATGGPVFAGTGNPHMDLSMNLRRVLVMAVMVYPLTNVYGIIGTSTSVVLGLAATLPVWARTLPLVGVAWRLIFKKCWPAIALTVFVLFGLSLARSVTSADIKASLFLEISIVSILYGVGALMIWRIFESGPFGPIIRIFFALRNAK